MNTKQIWAFLLFVVLGYSFLLVSMEKEPVKTSDQKEQVSPLNELPLEVQQEIIKYLVDAQGDTDEQKLIDATKNIRSLLMVNKNLAQFLSDQPLTKYLIDELAKRYTNGDKIKAGAALGTTGAGAWLAAYAQDDQHLEQITSYLFALISQKTINQEEQINNFALKYFPKSDVPKNPSEKSKSIKKELNPQIVSFVLKYIPALVETESLHREPFLIAAARIGNDAIFEKLITIPSINVNITWAARSNALMWAALGGHARIIEKLLTIPSIDVNAQNLSGLTALMYAAQQGHLLATEKLLAKPGIDVNIQNNVGKTALIMAVENGHEEIVKKLLAMPGININLKARDGATALYQAQLSNKPTKEAIIKLLKDKGAQ